MTTAAFASLVESADPAMYDIQTHAAGPTGSLPLTDDLLRHARSGDIFGLTRTSAWVGSPTSWAAKEFLILSTRAASALPTAAPIALGYHTGHWEVGLLMQAAAEELQGSSGSCRSPAYCTDPCDGRTQGTAGMMDSLPYRNDAAHGAAPADPLAADAARRASAWPPATRVCRR